MRIHLGTDHAGLDFSRQLFEHLTAAGHEVVDHGPTSYDPIDDYPSFCIDAALGVVRDQRAGVDALGIVFGGSGNGEQIAANKVSGARAALVWSEATALLARQHNDANLIAIGARQHTVEEAVAFIDTFIAEPFSFEERHVRRIAQLAEYEATGAIAGEYVGADVSPAAPTAGATEPGVASPPAASTATPTPAASTATPTPATPAAAPAAPTAPSAE